jgi:predicted DsbA family dithiol-disulfide isomerase
LQAEHDIEVDWRGLEIHPEIPEEGLHWPPYLRARFGGMSDMLREEAQQAGLPMLVPEVISKSRRALELTEYVRTKGQRVEVLHELIWRKYYGEGKDLSSWQMLRAVTEEVGLDADEMQKEIESGAFSTVIDANRRELAALGATGVPLFIFDKKYAVIGLQPYAAFEEVMVRIEEDGGGA